MKKTFYLLSLILLIASCTRKTNYPVNSDLKSSFSYKPGTYWIYRDSISGEMDSFYVTEQHLDNYKNEAENYTYDQIGTYICQVSLDSNLSDTSKWRISILKNQIYVEWSWYSNEDYFLFGPIQYPFVVKKNGDENNRVVAIIPNYDINGITFSNIAVCNSDTVSQVYATIQINADAGIIKINGRSTMGSGHKIWELQRWHLVR